MNFMCTPTCTDDDSCVSTYLLPAGTKCATASTAVAIGKTEGVCYAPEC